MACSLVGKSRKQAQIEKKNRNPVAIVACDWKHNQRSSWPVWWALPNLLKLLHENQATSSVIVIGRSFSSIILYFFGHCFVKKNDRHSNSHKWCNPSPSQNATVRARKGDTLLSIPLALAATLRVLFHSRTKPLAIKDLLHEHQALPDWITSSFQKFYWEG